MEKPYILHMLTPSKNLSPFDVNMALDANWTTAIPYTKVELDEVEGLVQDAIFSRSPSGVKRTGIFIGGRDMQGSMDMMEIAKHTMLPPFEVSVFADPSGAFTTAAAMVAAVEYQLQKVHNTGLEGKTILALGGTGPVGSTAALLAAQAGASAVYVIGRKKDKAQRIAALVNHEYGADVTGIKGDADDHKGQLMETADIVFATAAAGIQVLSTELVASAPQLKVAADVNAVPPSGIAGLNPDHDGQPIEGSKSGAVGVGALAIGNVKYQTQQKLLKMMIDADKPVYLDFEDAFRVAREYVKTL